MYSPPSTQQIPYGRNYENFKTVGLRILVSSAVEVTSTTFQFKNSTVLCSMQHPKPHKPDFVLHLVRKYDHKHLQCSAAAVLVNDPSCSCLRPLLTSTCNLCG